MRSGSRAGYETSAASTVRPPRAPATSPAAGGNERIAALSALVEELTGQIDAIEGASRRETIRRGVQQAAARTDAAPPAAAAQPARPVADERIQRLGAIESRLAAIADRIVERDRPVEPPVPHPREARGAFDSLQAAIAEISARQEAIDRAGGRHLPAVDSLAIEDALRELRADIGALEKRIAAEARRGEEFGRSLRSEFAQLAIQPSGGVSESALAGLRSDLSQIREALDLSARETTLASIESGYGHVIERLDDIVRRVPERDRLEALAREVGRLAQSVEQAPRSARNEGELEDIRNAIASLSIGRSDDGLAQQIAELRHAVERIGDDAFSAQDLARIEQRLDILAGRLEAPGELRHAVERLAEQSLGADDLSRIEQRLDLLAGRLDAPAELRHAIEHLAEQSLGADDIGRIEQRLDLLAGRLDAPAELRHAIEHLAEHSLGTDDLARIEQRLDALAGRFDGSSERRLHDIGLAIEKLAARPRDTVDLSRIERDIGAMRREIDGFAKGTDPVALIRLEQQVAAIRSAIEEKLPMRPEIDGGALARLEQRLDALAGRLDALADLPSLVVPASSEALSGLHSEISNLRAEVATRQPVRLDEIEQQMRGLISRLDDSTGRDEGAAALAQLEAQVGSLAEKLATIEPGSEALAKVETNLDRLQSLLADARRDTLEAARTTARTTVEEFAGSLAAGRDDDVVLALREDLKRLQEAALRADQENQDTLEAVHDTLAKVVDRIAQLEAEDAGMAVGFGSIRDRARSVITSRGLGIEDLPEDHRPLVPGSGKPELPAPPLRAEGEAAPRPGDRKADFIAAARRAAQAAQAETARVRAEDRKAEGQDGKPGPLARIGQALRSRRRPLVLAIAAVVLAIGAAKFGPPAAYRLADAVVPLVTNAQTAVASRSEPLDKTVTASIAPKPVRAAEPNVAPAARIAAAPPATSAPPAMVAPKANSKALAFSPDPFANFLAAAPAPAAASAPAADPSGLDYKIIEAAATKGDAIAAFEMARHFAEPVVGRPDIQAAAKWYQRAASAGFALAQYRLGSLYERGEGVTLDVAQAQAWYEKAGAKGNARAIHNLAVLISEGAGGPPDYKRAADLFSSAANFGVADSQYNLGVLYARGLGVPVDLVQSYKWFALAAQQGDGEAGKRRDEVAKAMKDGDLATARLAVQGFEAKPLDPVANNDPAPDPAWYSPARPATAAAGSPGADGSAG